MKLPKNIDVNAVGTYCIHCGNKDRLTETSANNQKRYSCNKCGKQSDRAIIIDSKVLIEVNPSTREIIHKSVGALIFNENNEVLLFNLTKFPFGFTIPAGHIDINELPKEAAAREVEEETGLTGLKLHKVAEFWIDKDSCRRGADKHYWYVFSTKIDSLEQVISVDASEGVSPGWFSLDDIGAVDLAYAAKVVLEHYVRQVNIP